MPTQQPSRVCASMWGCFHSPDLDANARCRLRSAALLGAIGPAACLGSGSVDVGLNCLLCSSHWFCWFSGFRASPLRAAGNEAAAGQAASKGCSEMRTSPKGAALPLRRCSPSLCSQFVALTLRQPPLSVLPPPRSSL